MGDDSVADGLAAVAIGRQTSAIGGSAVAMGFQTSATAGAAVALGRETVASGGSSTALGSATTASNIGSTSMGSGTLASGRSAMATGRFTIAQAYSSVALGQYNIGGGDSENWTGSDPVFEVGNGLDETSRSNALTVLKNGIITAPSFDISEITEAKALITKEYADLNFTPTGLSPIDQGNGIGWRLNTPEILLYGDIGENAVDLSWANIPLDIYGALGISSFAFGRQITSSGDYAVAGGRFSSALGDYAVAIGFAAQANGDHAVALGHQTEARTFHSLALGNGSRAIGDGAMAIGYNTRAEAAYSTAMGRNNIGGGSPSNLILTDPIFEIGNGANAANRSNALTVLRNGKVGIGENQPAGFLEIKALNSGGQPNINLIHEGTTGARINFKNTETSNDNVWTLYGDTNNTRANSIFNLYHPNAPNGGNIVQVRGDGRFGVNANPDTELHVRHGSNGGSDGFRLENSGSNDNWWRMYVVNGTGHLNLYSKSQTTTSIGNFDDVSGAYTSTSDRRLKKNFKELHFNWQDFMKLETLTYQYKVQKENNQHIGLVAQDVEAIYPELVNYNGEEDVYHLNYSGFGVVAIKAIQEQQKIIEDQATKIEKLEAKLSERETAFQSLNDRMIQIEAKLKGVR